MERSCKEFVEVLAGKDPVPGGGGASALVGAIGTALGNMVGSLTIGKKQYADVQGDIESLRIQADRLQTEFLVLIEKDTVAFAPLAEAYRMPKETEEEREEKARTMETCLVNACLVPLEIMEKCGEAIALHREFAEKGTRIAISDVGVGVIFCKAALQGASLNVFINTSSMINREKAEELEDKATGLLTKYMKLADEIYEEVSLTIRGKE